MLKARKDKIKVSKTLHIGHGNDCCVRDGVLLVTHSGKSNAIRRIDAKSLEKLPDAIVTGCLGDLLLRGWISGQEGVQQEDL